MILPIQPLPVLETFVFCLSQGSFVTYLVEQHPCCLTVLTVYETAMEHSALRRILGVGALLRSNLDEISTSHC
jgi:hypothetical protein